MPKMTILLTEGDYARLVELAEKDKRHPQDEALVLLRSVLFGDAAVDAIDDLRQRVKALEEAQRMREGEL